MGRYPRDTRHSRNALGRDATPLRNCAPAEAELTCNQGDQAAFRSDQVHSVHNRPLSITKRPAQEKSLSASKLISMHNLCMDVGDLIRQKRDSKGISQRALAKLVRVTPGAVAQWELNQTRPTEQNMAALKILLDFDAGPAEPAPGAPYRGKLIDDPDLLAWINFLEDIPKDERMVLAKHIMGSLTLPKKA